MSDETKPGKTDSAGKPGTGTQGTAKTLDELRADYEAALASKSAPDKGSNKELEALRTKVANLEAEAGDRAYRKEMDQTIVPAVKGDLKVDEEIVEMWVNREAGRDAALMALWNDRAEKPKEFKEAIAALAPEFKKYAESKGLVQPAEKGAGKSDDKGKLQSAVRSARETQPTKKDFGDKSLAKMSDQEFAQHSQEVFAAVRAGQL